MTVFRLMDFSRFTVIVFLFLCYCFHFSRLLFSCFTVFVFTFCTATSSLEFSCFTFLFFICHDLSFHLTQFWFSFFMFDVSTSIGEFHMNRRNSLWTWKSHVANLKASWRDDKNCGFRPDRPNSRCQHKSFVKWKCNEAAELTRSARIWLCTPQQTSTETLTFLAKNQQLRDAITLGK